MITTEKNIDLGTYDILPYEIKGKVLSKSGEPLYGAHVSTEVNFSNGVSTFEDGLFILPIEPQSVLFYIAYQGKVYDVHINEFKANSNIAYIEDTNTLNEVVIIAQKTTLFVGFLIALAIYYLTQRTDKPNLKTT